MFSSKDTSYQNSTQTFMFDYQSAFDYGQTLIKTSSPMRNSQNYRSIYSYSQGVLYDSEPQFSSPEKSKKESVVSQVIRNIMTVICYVMVLITLPLTGWLSIKKVPALERVVIFRMGKMLPVKGPGFVIILPCLDHWMKVDLKPRSFNIDQQQLLTADGGILEADVVFQYCVIDVQRCVLRVQELHRAMEQLAKQGLINLLSQKDMIDITKQKKSLETDVKADINKTTLQWGLELMDVNIGPVKVIKAAEPSNSIKPVIASLKTAFGMHSETEDASSLELKSIAGPLSNSVAETIPQDFNSLVKMIEQLAQASLSEKEFKENAVIRLDVEGPDGGVINIILSNGVVQVATGSSSPSDPNVEITLSKETLSKILCLKTSPRQAYLEGDIQVSGDWGLLYSFSTIISNAH
ncbi:stomatin-like protein 3 [Limulus polyphemus]|uniref:Stomatin-like protein 3 n=1 Tax=Limulus polyphemus TaxID=6850 RepID=A0ABM1SV17_LIMPO|nr:stomatin-like protein 3 [Limulus polyphemus]